MQYLIMPVNDATVTASFLNSNYRNKFGFSHWGVDMYGADSIVYSQGHGVVISEGFDNMYGNFVQVLYLNCANPGRHDDMNVIANYFHLKCTLVKVGKRVTKDTSLGIMGSTGTYATGIHLHLEMRIYKTGENFNLSPYASNNFVEDQSALWFNPLEITHVKKTRPDSQKIRFSDEIYTNELDRNEVLYCV